MQIKQNNFSEEIKHLENENNLLKESIKYLKNENKLLKEKIFPNLKEKELEKIKIIMNSESRIGLILRFRREEYLTIEGLKQVIYENFYIPKYRQSLLFDGNEELNQSKLIADINFKNFKFQINNKPNNFDYFDIEVKDFRRTDKKDNCENYKLNVDLYQNIIKQISEKKNINNSNLYYIYKNEFYFLKDDNYEIFKDHHFGKKISIELHDVDINGSIEIVIKTLNGKTLNVKVDPNEMVYNLKFRIQKIESLPINKQRLIFNGIQLEDNRTLIYYNIKNGSVLNLVLRL